MPKTRRAKGPRSVRGRSRPPEAAPTPAALDLSLALVDETHHRFPWPANPRQRYGLESPYLAIVNARGPWAVWKHGRANPPFVPLCLDLLEKDFWRKATNDQRVFALTCWLRAAQEDDWGIVWGDPVRLCHQWGLDPVTFTARLDWLIGAGLACYLTAAEYAAARDPWRYWDADAWRRAQRGGNTRGGQEQAESSQAEQGQGQARQGDPAPADLQGSSPCASAQQIPDSKGQEQAQHSKSQHSKSQHSNPSTAQHRAQGQPQGTEPANLPKSDQGAVGGSPRTPGGVRGQQTHGRPRSALCPSAVPLGDLLGWSNPTVVEFGRGMYEAITGHAPPADLTAAPDAVKADVGVWVHYWAKQVEPSLDIGRRAEFAERCYRDVARKRKVRSIRNLGRVAMAKIVPGILAAMRGEGGG